MPATPEGVRAQLARAGRAAREAAAGFERDSRTALTRLKARSMNERFAALEDGAPQLLPEHRRELLLSIRDQSDGVEPPAGPAVRYASRVEIWRGRLPFRARPLIRDALLGLCLVVAVGLAYRRTPAYWVELDGDRDLATAWIMPSGQPAGDRLVAGRAYGLMRVIDGIAELRDWHPGEGYAATRVPAGWLRARSGPASR